MFYVDETHVRAYQALRTTWARSRESETSAKLRTPWPRFYFWRRLKEKYADRFLVLVLDNARIHHAKMVQAFLDGEEGDAFHFIFLPPYSPQLNPIERLWKWLKDEVIANVFQKDQNDIAQSITRFEQYVLQHPDEVLRAWSVLCKSEVKMPIWMYIFRFILYTLYVKYIV